MAPRLTPAVMRSLDILELFLRPEVETLSAAEVLEKTGLPRTAAFEIVATLLNRNYLSKDPETGRYSLGLQLYQLGKVVNPAQNILEVGIPVTEELGRLTKETINLGILDDFDILYLHKVESTHPVRMVSKTGGRIPAHYSALGKALLANLPEKELELFFDKAEHTAPLTESSITAIPVLRQEIKKVAQQQIAFESNESTPGVSCVAAPIRDSQGNVLAALSISVPNMRWISRSPEEWAEIVSDGAAKISARIGYVSN